jgi:predicted nucleic acid-binding protein
MSAEVLLDTNVLIYAHDDDCPQKQLVAQELVSSLRVSRRASVSAQVLGEYASVVARRFRDVIPATDLQAQLERFVRMFTVHPNTAGVVIEAVRGTWRHGFSYYDAQIWAVAKLNGIPLVYSEDFAHGSEVEGVRFENPFIDVDDRDSSAASR